jgi:hypothetical protein
LEGPIAMAIVMSFFIQMVHFSRRMPIAQPSHSIVKLDTKAADTIAGEYEFPRDNVFRSGAKLRIWREDDRLFGEASGRGVLPGVLDICAESETNFFVKQNDAQLTFIRNDAGVVTGLVHHMEGILDSRATKLPTGK